jgi:hypothetical protein
MTPALPWHEPGWLPIISAWLEDELLRRGCAPRGPVTLVQARPWSVVLRVPTTAGACYGKAVAPALAHEVELTAALARWRPDCLPAVLAVDRERGWLLPAACALAQPLGMVCRALTWRHVLTAVPGWLGEFLAAVA